MNTLRARSFQFDQGHAIPSMRFRNDAPNSSCYRRLAGTAFGEFLLEWERETGMALRDSSGAAESDPQDEDLWLARQLPIIRNNGPQPRPSCGRLFRSDFGLSHRATGRSTSS